MPPVAAGLARLSSSRRSICIVEKILADKTPVDEDREANRFSARAARYARVGLNAGGMAMRLASTRLLRQGEAGNAAALAQALGGLKGPLMKVAQLMATVPLCLPAGYAAERPWVTETTLEDIQQRSDIISLH